MEYIEICTKVKRHGICDDERGTVMKIKSGFIFSTIKGIQLMYQYEAKMLLKHIFFSFLHGSSWAIQVVFSQRFFDAAHNLVRQKIGLEESMLALFCMIAAYTFCQIMNGVDNCHARILSLAIARHTSQRIFEKVDEMDSIEFENPNKLDSINKAINGGENFVWVCITLLDTIFFYITYFVVMSLYLFTLKPILSVAIFAIFIPCILSNMLQIRTFKMLEDDVAPLRRRCNYYEKCASDIRETRLWGITDYFRRTYYQYLDKYNRLVIRAQLKKGILNMVSDLLTVIGYACILYMVFISVLRQEITIGAFTAVLASVSRLFSFMSEVISERISWASENVVTLDNYLNFVSENRNTMREDVSCELGDITLENIKFAYPEAMEFALKGIDLKIKKGESIAIVGENGSGKTTLCKILLGLYEPTEGNIIIDNMSVDKVPNINCSAIFQSYNKYKMSLKENIIISNKQSNCEDSDVEMICKHTGIDLDQKTMPEGVQTMIGREFDGIELSGGQWQRVAIARGIYRNNELIVLDEPTAAIDPLEETRLYKQFANICRNKSAVIVTHRLGSARIADCIVVMKNGHVVEIGEHEELLAHNGEYKRLYELQKEWYID